MDYNKLKILWKQDEKVIFKGWDFSYIGDRQYSEGLPWDYERLVRQYLKPHSKLLDIGTGGGEFLLSLNHPFENTSVTEMWEPNVCLCKEKLSPLGIKVKQVFYDTELPFKDNSFDIIINRHASFYIPEIKRILKPNGIFITQQVGGKNNESLSKALIKDFKPKFKNHCLTSTLKVLKENSFHTIYSNECFPYLRFKDMGTLIYFAKIIEWEFPNFSVESSFEELVKLNKSLLQYGYIESKEHRFIVLCKNLK